MNIYIYRSRKYIHGYFSEAKFLERKLLGWSLKQF